MLVYAGLPADQRISLVGNVNSYPAAGYNDIWGYTAPDNREYALLGVRNGTSIVEVTNPSALVERDFIPGPLSSWKDLKTYLHYAYVVTESSGGMQIIDLSTLPDSASLVNTFTGFSTSHNIFIDENSGILYAEGNFSEPVRVLSLDNPVSPVPISVFGIECHDIFVRDTLAFVSEGTQGSFGIYSIRNPYQPAFLTRIQVPAGGYAHNAWSNDNNTLLLTTEETPGKTVKIWDISDLNNITLIGQYLGASSLAHNVLVDGHFAFISHYETGLVILDITDPANPIEVGSYDSYPQGNSPGYNGAWGVYPFTNNGMVFLSDIQTGLYVFDFDTTVVNIPSPDPLMPTNFALLQNYPNPFNAGTVISWQLAVGSPVNLTVYNISGQKVATLLNEIQEAGFHSVRFNVSGLPSGVYIYHLDAGQFSQTRRMIYQK